MMASKSISMTQVMAITECVICTELFKEPKVLPCIHTFCLHCLEKYGEDNDPGDKVKCPLCRKQFTIPQGGFKDLPNNYFIIQLMQLGQSSGNESKEQYVAAVVCDWCAELDEKPPAKMFCIECQQHLCQPCCTMHGKHKSSKGHQVVSLKDKPSTDQLKKMTQSYCEKHPSKEIEFYCYDCKMIACYMCCVESHNTHKCSDVKKAGEELRGTIPKNIQKVVPCIAKNRACMKEIEEKKKSLIDEVAAAKGEIGKKYDQLKSLLDSHRDQLNTELDLFKVKTLKELYTREEEVERQSVILESYKRYSVEMQDKGTAVDISRTACDLHVRADELVKMQEELATSQLPQFEIKFISLPTVTDTNNNWIGKLGFKVDPKKGFGGKFGVEMDKKDNSALGYDDKSTTELQASQVDHKKDFGEEIGNLAEKMRAKRLAREQQEKVESSGNIAIALYDYQAVDNDELTFDPDDTISNIEFIDDGWWKGSCHGRTGLFPSNYVKLKK